MNLLNKKYIPSESLIAKCKKNKQRKDGKDTILHIDGEEWKEYKYGYYFSNLGRVKSTKNGKELIMSLNKDKDGYNLVSVCDGFGGIYKVKVHRIISELFIDNPYNLTDVNHKNKIKNDNRVSNLEWSSHRDNLVHGSGKLVALVDDNDNILKRYESIADAANKNNVAYQNVSAVCNGRIKHIRRLKFKFL